MSFLTAANSLARIKFGDPDANNAGAIIYNHGDNTLRINTNSAERFRIDSQGRVGIGGSSLSGKLEVRDSAAQGILISSTQTQATDTNKAIRVRNNSDTDTFYVSHKGKVYAADNILMASGKGIDFSATGDGINSSSSSSELLDDYEEGTWVPTVTQGTISYGDAYYTKVGRMVHVTGYVNNWSDRTGSSNIGIQGLPYSVSHGGQMGSAVFYRVAHTDDGQIGTVLNSSGQILFLSSSQGGSESWFYLQYSDLNDSNSQIKFSVFYAAA
jgi:hypothetical protein